MAAAGYHTSRSPSDALARLNADGTVDVQTATSDMGPGTYTSMTPGRGRRARAANGARAVRARRQPLPERAVALRVAHDGQRRLRRIHRRKHVARQGSSYRRHGSRVSAERCRAAGRDRDRRPDVRHRRSEPRRDVPGSAAPPWLAHPGLPADVVAGRCRQAVLHVRLRRGVRRGCRRRGAWVRADPPHLTRATTLAAW